MKTEFRLIGLSKPRSATLQFLDTDKEIFWAKIDMPEDRIKALWDYVSGNWDKKYIAEVEHSSVDKDGVPINAVMNGVREWDLPY